jgi:hypothetical protein
VDEALEYDTLEPVRLADWALLPGALADWASSFRPTAHRPLDAAAVTVVQVRLLRAELDVRLDAPAVCDEKELLGLLALLLRAEATPDDGLMDRPGPLRGAAPGLAMGLGPRDEFCRDAARDPPVQLSATVACDKAPARAPPLRAGPSGDAGPSPLWQSLSPGLLLPMAWLLWLLWLLRLVLPDETRSSAVGRAPLGFRTAPKRGRAADVKEDAENEPADDEPATDESGGKGSPPHSDDRPGSGGGSTRGARAAAEGAAAQRRPSFRCTGSGVDFASKRGKAPAASARASGVASGVPSSFSFASTAPPRPPPKGPPPKRSGRLAASAASARARSRRAGSAAATARAHALSVVATAATFKPRQSRRGIPSGSTAKSFASRHPLPSWSMAPNCKCKWSNKLAGARPDSDSMNRKNSNSVISPSPSLSIAKRPSRDKSTLSSLSNFLLRPPKLSKNSKSAIPASCIETKITAKGM